MTEKKKSTLAQSLGITRDTTRDRAESDLTMREDRIGRYFRKYLNKFVFKEFSPEFMEKSKASDLMKGVPIPLRKEDVKDFAGGEGVKMSILADNMAWVMGCDPHFKHTKDYTAILNHLYNDKIDKGIVKSAKHAAERGELDDACIHFRAALCAQHDNLHAMYGYARACRAIYLASNNDEYVGRFKAEALDWFELITETHPKFAQGYYYLGYAYLNMGLYIKADLTWKAFLKHSTNGKDRKEIKTRRAQLETPIQIESGYNDVMATRYEDGAEKLEPFLNSQYKDWWPLHYYLGVAYEMTGRNSEAIASLKQVLTLNASHLETMQELVNIYDQTGDNENKRKYEKKIELIRRQFDEEQQTVKTKIEQEDKALQEKEPTPQEPELIEDIE